MGLKTTNYVSKSTGLTLPEAYAMLTHLSMDGNHVCAIFSIHTTRKYLEDYKPIDKVNIDFEWDRKTDIAKMAYNTAKKETKMVFIRDIGDEDKIPRVKNEHGVLFGWQDDIIEDDIIKDDIVKNDTILEKLL